MPGFFIGGAGGGVDVIPAGAGSSFDSIAVFSADAVNPAAAAVLWDTGALAGGVYELFVSVAVVPTVGAPNPNRITVQVHDTDPTRIFSFRATNGGGSLGPVVVRVFPGNKVQIIVDGANWNTYTVRTTIAMRRLSQ